MRKERNAERMMLAVVAIAMLFGFILSARAGDLDYVVMRAVCTTATNAVTVSNQVGPVSNEVCQPRGYIRELYCRIIPATTVDANVTLMPEKTGYPTKLLTGKTAATADWTCRPLEDATDTNNAALTSDPPQPIPMYWGYLRLYASNVTATCAVEVVVGYEKK